MVQTQMNVDSKSDKCQSEKYYESIDFSNHCRKFYFERQKAADDIKQKVQKESKDTLEIRSQKTTTSISPIMARLRKEMASLMDQDISLMRQLLTLNETIEEIKQKRLYGVSKDSLRASSMDLSASDDSVSETDMYCNDDMGESKLGPDQLCSVPTEVKETTL